ncbi:MAG: hypothetical protein QNM02_10795 [Acidimicrobiia bacterium]|nr:hypothetical protein [Acidimicrobiia bacterium]
MTDLSIGYDPARIRTLGRRTSDSIRALDAISSSDPAAADAMRVVRLIRQNLGDLWMPLIREIEHSTSMTDWTSHPLNQHRLTWIRPDAWLTHSGGAKDPRDRDLAARDQRTTATIADAAFRSILSRLDDEELLDRVAEMSKAQARAGIELDPGDPDWMSMLAALAAELDDRLARDADGSFARNLLEMARRSPLIALAAPYSPHLSVIAPELALAMLDVESWVPELHPATYELGVDAVLGLLDDSPGACLDLLLDDGALRSLAGWESLDADAVNRVVWNGLAVAVGDAPERLLDGYEVLRSLIGLANGSLDGGFAPGTARGVADSLTTYIDTLAPAVRYEGGAAVTVHWFDPDASIKLGTYDELVDLYGAVLRDEVAQASIGVAIGAYTDRVVADLGRHIGHHAGIEHVARFTDLISDAARSEQAEIMLAAAASHARRERMGALVTFGANVALGPAGSFGGHVVRVAARTVVQEGSVATPTRPREILDLSISSTIHRQITVAVLELVSGDPGLRTGEHLEGVTDEQWGLLREHLDDIEAAGGDLTERNDRVDRMDRFIETFIPPLGGYLRTVRSAPGVDELEEDRAAAAADDDR